MNNDITNLRNLIEKIRTIGFWKRLFSWSHIKDILVDANADLQKLITGSEGLAGENNQFRIDNAALQKDLTDAREDLGRRDSELETMRRSGQANITLINELREQAASNNTTIENQNERIRDLEETGRTVERQSTQLAVTNSVLTEELATARETSRIAIERRGELETDLAVLGQTLEAVRSERDELRDKVTQFTSEEDSRRTKYDTDLANLNAVRQQIHDDRVQELEDRQRQEIERLESRKRIWSEHETTVKHAIKGICNKHTIEYVDNVTFTGKPDNTIKICDEYIIFDAKSPLGEESKNFQAYLRAQAEAAKKYAKQEGVKPDIYLVVPANTLGELTAFVYNLGDYDVFIISIDSLEQIILSLKKIEEYEFAEALSPEERDNICRLLGKFAHLTKRRIQIDAFFARQFIELAFKSESELPHEFLEKVIEYERQEKLNPPSERRTKTINLTELADDTRKLQGETSSKGIVLAQEQLLAGLNEVQLYETDEPNPPDLN